MVKQDQDNEQGQSAPEQKPKTRKSWRNAGLVLWGLVLVAVVFVIVQRQASDAEIPCPPAVNIPGNEPLGGSFTAIDENGKTVSEKDVFQGPSLVYFGYTYCPDVCPLDTARNAEITDQLAEQGVDITPVFITVDPERDTPEVLREYTSYVHDDMVGLTGSDAQITLLETLFKVRASKEESDDPEAYLMNHTAFSYLTVPPGDVIAVYARTQSAEEVSQNIQCQLEAHGYSS